MRELLKSPELRIVVINALTQPLGAIVLALGIIIGFQVWTPFLAIGVIGYLAIVITTLADQAENQRIVQAELHPPRRIDLSALVGGYLPERGRRARRASPGRRSLAPRPRCMRTHLPSRPPASEGTRAGTGTGRS